MKKALSFLIMSAVCLFTQVNVKAEGLSLVGTLQYETEHYVRGLNYSDDALGVGVNGSYDLGFANAFGGMYNVPRLGGNDSVNHSVLGLSRSFELIGLTLDSSIEVQHHNAAVDSTEVGLGVSIPNLPLIQKLPNTILLEVLRKYLLELILNFQVRWFQQHIP